MTARVIRYKTKDGSGDENERLVKSVFRELDEKSPEGLRYAVLRLGDGSFIHIVDAAGAENPLRGVKAFQAFQAGIAGRCIDPPEFADATIIGNYRVFR
jgi:hypothetical protein